MKKAKIISFIFIITLFSVFLSFNRPVLAGSYWDMQVGLSEVGDAFNENPADTEDVRYTVVRIINFILQLLALILVILIIFAGFQWMTAAGNEEKVKKAQSTLKNAVIGLIIITLAWSITFFIIRRLDAVSQNDPNYLKPLITN